MNDNDKILLKNKLEAEAKLHKDRIEAAVKNPFTAYAQQMVDYYLNSNKYKLKHHCETCSAKPDKTVHKWKGCRMVKVPKRYTFSWFTYPHTKRDFMDWGVKGWHIGGRYETMRHRITLNVDLLDGPKAKIQGVLMHEIAHALSEQWHYYPERLVKEYGRWGKAVDAHDARWRDIAKELGAHISKYDEVSK
jgi:hypothetical protein